MQGLPEQAGIELANWYWRVVREFVLKRFWHRVEPQQLFELPAPLGVCPEASQEAPAQG